MAKVAENKNMGGDFFYYICLIERKGKGLNELKTFKMSINFTFEVDNDLLRVTASGKGDNLEEVQEYGMAIIGACIE